MLIERVPWRVQPQTVQRLSPSVPRPALLLHGGAGFIDTIRQRTVTPNGVSIVAGQGGRGFKAASNASVGASFGTSQLSTSDGAGSGDFSLLLVASPVASTTREIMFCVRDGSRELYFTANCTVGLVASSGRIAVQTNVGGAIGISVAGSVDGQLHTWLFTRQGTSQRLYRDGVLHASSTESVRQIWTSSSTDMVGGYTAANWGVSSSILLVGGWNSALSESDALSLSANPWQLFEPRRIWVPVSVSTAGAYTLTADAGAFTLSGQDATLLKSKLLTADAGSYAIAGQDANLVYTPAAGAYTLTADAGAFQIGGQDATFVYTPLNHYTLTAEAGAYQISGQQAQLIYTGQNVQDTHDGFWTREWLKLREREKKKPTIAEVVEVVKESPAVVEMVRPQVEAKYPDVDYSQVLANVQLQRFIARQLLEMMQEEDDLEALLLL